MFGESSKNRDLTPFQGDLENFDEGKYHEVFLPVEDPDVVIKSARTNWKKGQKPGAHPLNNPESTQRAIEVLKDNFTEYIPPTQIVLGKNKNGEVNVYTIQSRIEGQNLDQIPYSEEMADRLREFLNKALDFYISTLQSDPVKGTGTCPDLKGRHLVFGVDKKRGETNPRLYFIDLYPLSSDPPDYFLNTYIPKTRDKYFAAQWREVLDEFHQQARQRLESLSV